MAENIDSDYTMYTKQYAREALLCAVREPMCAWFRFICQCAKNEADKDTMLYEQSNGKQGNPDGKYKHLVYFQKRCKSIRDYSDGKIEKIIAAFKRDNDELRSLDAFIWAILLTNCMILGAFGQQDVDAHSVKVPTDTQFIHEWLTIAGSKYYSDPKAALRQGGESIVEYALDRTIHSIVPFEMFVDDIRKKESFRSVSGSDAKRYAQRVITQAHDLGSRSRVKDAASNYLCSGTTEMPNERTEICEPSTKRRRVGNFARTSFPDSIFADHQAPARWDSEDYQFDDAPPIDVDIGTLSNSDTEINTQDARHDARPADDRNANDSDDLGFDD